MCVYTYMYMYVCIIIHTQPLEEYARKLLTEIAFARGISGARRLTFYLLFLLHFNVFAYSKIHLYIETNKSQLRRLRGNTVLY